MEIVSDSVLGEQSLNVADNVDDNSPVWSAGPVLDLSETFRIEGTIKSTIPEQRTRLGIEADEGSRALLIFSDEFNATFLATSMMMNRQRILMILHLAGNGSTLS